MPGNAVGGVVADSTRPLAVRIPAIDVDSPLVPLGLDPHGALEVPRDYDTAGWYRYGPRPGDLGPSLIAAHVDSTSGPAAFFRLPDISPGDDVLVDYDDGTTVVFRVARVEQHPKDAFPTQRVYGQVAGRQLRLVTCGGVFDSRTGHYRDNIIVYAYVRSERRTAASL